MGSRETDAVLNSSAVLAISGPALSRARGGIRPSHCDRLLRAGRCGSALARLRLDSIL